MKHIVELSDPEQPIQYIGDVLASGTSSLQDWVVLRTQTDGDCLFINQQLQSSTRDESLYHEMIVHSLLAGTRSPKRVLILGGSEGCMLREVLRWSTVESVHQVDWDEGLCRWFQTDGAYWNQGAYQDPRVHVTYEDALLVLRQSESSLYDAVFIDLLDPHTEDDLAFITSILANVKRVLKPGGGLCVNVGLVKPGQQTPACDVARRMKSIFTDPAFHRCAFKVHIPSYVGEWGFLLATSQQWSHVLSSSELPSGLQHFTHQRFIELTQWSPDYPDELATFWKQVHRSWASVITDTQQGTKKLVCELDRSESIEIRNHYGC